MYLYRGELQDLGAMIKRRAKLLKQKDPKEVKRLDLKIISLLIKAEKRG